MGVSSGNVNKCQNRHIIFSSLGLPILVLWKPGSVAGSMKIMLHMHESNLHTVVVDPQKIHSVAVFLSKPLMVWYWYLPPSQAWGLLQILHGNYHNMQPLWQRHREQTHYKVIHKLTLISTSSFSLLCIYLRKNWLTTLNVEISDNSVIFHILWMKSKTPSFKLPYPQCIYKNNTNMLF